MWLGILVTTAVHITASMCKIFRASDIWALVSIWPYMPTRKARCSSTAACSVEELRSVSYGPTVPLRAAGGRWVGGSPWQSRVYSGRFLRAVCTTSKSRLPRQYMKVGRKSAAMLQETCSFTVITRWPRRSGKAPVSPAHTLTSYCLVQLAWGDSGPRLGLYLPGVVLDRAQCKAEGQVSAGLLRGAHQTLQVGLLM